MKKKHVTYGQIILVGFFAFLALGAIATFVFNPSNNDDVSRWCKVNFFPSDTNGAGSVLDVSQSQVLEQNYTGSTSEAWVVCGFVATAVAIGSFVFLAKEHGMI